MVSSGSRKLIVCWPILMIQFFLQGVLGGLGAN